MRYNVPIYNIAANKCYFSFSLWKFTRPPPPSRRNACLINDVCTLRALICNDLLLCVRVIAYLICDLCKTKRNKKKTFESSRTSHQLNVHFIYSFVQIAGVVHIEKNSRKEKQPLNKTYEEKITFSKNINQKICI